MKKYNVTLEIVVLDTIYDIEAKTKKEAVERARIESNYKEGDISVYEIEKVN